MSEDQVQPNPLQDPPQDQVQPPAQPQQSPPPPFDPEAIRTLVADTLRGELDRRDSVQTQLANDLVNDPVARTIAPVVGPALQAVSLQAQAAADAATFYTGSDEDMELKARFRADIESKFHELMQTGRPVPRQDIFQWLIGGPKRTEYVEWEMRRREQKTRAAELAQTAGPGVSRLQAPAKPLDQMSDEELTELLKHGF